MQIINDFVGAGYGLLTLSLDPADNEVNKDVLCNSINEIEQ